MGEKYTPNLDGKTAERLVEHFHTKPGGKLGLKKQREAVLKNMGVSDFDGNDSWAQVELYRWQHGDPPPQDQTKCKDLLISEGLKAMAGALLDPNAKEKPTMFNLASVLNYAGKQLEGQEKLEALAKQIAGLNPDAGEIGAGMLANLVEKAREIIPIDPLS